MALRTAYLDIEQPDLAAQLEHALRERRTVLIYGDPRRSIRIAKALVHAEHVLHRSIRCTREHDRWVLTR